MTALCRHFGVCGGCAHQDMADYRAFKRALVIDALARHEISAVVEEIVEVPPSTRRRATLKARKSEDGVALGFHAAGTHEICDLQECLVLTPRLIALVPGLREMLQALLSAGEFAELRLADTDGGVDLSLRWQKTNDAATVAELARWAAKLGLARIARHGETLIERVRPSVHFGKAELFLPSEGFLQPTREGEAALQTFVIEALAGAKTIADLFCGCGTFALPIAERARVHAVDLDAAMLEALADATRHASGLKPVTTEKRNLFRQPLTENELASFDAVSLDPPRAGALAQVHRLASSKVERVAYISCDAETFARDARILIGGGYRLKCIQPVDQFLWSSHIELAASLERG